MYRLAICDDDIYVVKELERIVHTYNQKNFSIETYTSSKRLISEIKNHNKIFDLILLDIEIPEINGIESAIKIKEILLDVLIVFISGYDRALDAFKISAFKYITKPVSDKIIFSMLDDFVIENQKNLLYKQEILYYSYSNRDVSFKVRYNEILYFEKIKNQIILYYKKINGYESISFYQSLNQVEKSLDMSYFFRCHRSFIVNRNVIYYIKNQRIHIKPYKLSIDISRNKIDKVNDIISQNLFGGV